MKPSTPMVAVIIPARLGSSRFPNKPLASILGIPMIEWVRRHATATKHVDVVAVATCDQEIGELVQRKGGIALMTSATHQRASDRSAEALTVLEQERDAVFEIVVMLQGDEPTISPQQIDSVVDAMKADSSIQVANLFGPISSEEEFNDPNCIKVVADAHGDAVYFSRLPIPHGASFSDFCVGKQVCAIGFRRDYLMQYLTMDPTSLEKAESIDMLRILEHRERVRMVRTSERTQSVDIREDIPKAERVLSLRGLA